MLKLESHTDLDVDKDILGDQGEATRMERKPVPKKRN